MLDLIQVRRGPHLKQWRKPVDEVDDIMARLAAPFDAGEIKFKPAVVSGNRAMALAYVDARLIQDRLDEVMGIANWQDSYNFLADGSCLCKLSLRIAGEWITKMDIGGPSEQQDEGDKDKAAVSDALKRTAVKWGVGRFLYRLPAQWVDYDPQKKQFLKPPALPVNLLKANPVMDRRVGLSILRQARSLDDLALAWQSLTGSMKQVLTREKEELKSRLERIREGNGARQHADEQ